MSTERILHEVLEQLRGAVPGGFSLIERPDGMTLLDGQGFSGGAEFDMTEHLDGRRELTHARDVVFLIERILDLVQDFIADSSAEPWPSTERLPEPWVRRVQGGIEYGYGGQAFGTLELGT